MEYNNGQLLIQDVLRQRSASTVDALATVRDAITFYPSCGDSRSKPHDNPLRTDTCGVPEVGFSL